ncbi:hypothetical protein SI65_06756 [Aspergillus cristatus]|uniref:tRNA(Ile)-lysidine synthetase n=1 Tax=Aspergillus cristatus TaxID=573508 RepID=A0A1E3BAS2_ASPCR|nr:hypothetical protein SI65_06756 [Aspergillus cristatus]
MALAYLCKQLEKSGLVEDLSVTAFVVDHKAREESSREARMVKGWLDQLEITTKILELDWSTAITSEGKGKPSAFETFARRLRFQALGTACRDDDIETLMMGHHQDDNVETTVWRLCTGARGAGLMGIPQVARIPECHGIYGVAESGEAVTLSSTKMRTRVSRGVIASGGISICRPLLSFPKAKLLDICREHDVPFVNDPTNFDPTLTPRNAIRSLVSGNRLPRALTTPSILSLIQASQDLLKDSIDLSNEILRHCKLIDLNLTSGTMAIQFPPSPSAQPAGTIPTRRSTKNQDQRNHQIQAVTLRRITELVSPFPENHFPLRSFENFTERVFQPPSTEEPKRQPFTLGGVMFQPSQRELADAGDSGDTWFLSRQPFMRNRLPTLDFDIPVLPVIKQQEQHIHYSDRYEYTPWKLWDNRYWFRLAITPSTPSLSPPTTTKANDENGNEEILLTENTLPVTIRSLQQSDLCHLREYPSSSPSSSSTPPPSAKHEQPTQNKKRKKTNPLWAQLTQTLSRESPAQSRFTIPALFIQEQQESGVKEHLLALPTLDIRFPYSMSLSGTEISYEVHWEWQYKMIDEETVKSMSD